MKDFNTAISKNRFLSKASSVIMTRKAALPVILITLVFAAAALLIPVKGAGLGLLPHSRMSLDNAAWSYIAPNGTIFAADSGYQRLVCFDRLGNVLYVIEMSSSSRITAAASDEYGNVFVHVVETDSDSYISKSEVIKQFDSKGRFVRDVYVLDYSQMEEPSHRYIRINGLRLMSSGRLRFAMLSPDAVSMLELEPVTGELITLSYDETPEKWFRYNDISFLTDGSYCYTTRDGEVGRGDPNTQIEVSATDCSFDLELGGTLPAAITGSGSDIFFCDLNGKRVMQIDKNNGLSELLSTEDFESIGIDSLYLSVNSIDANNGMITGAAGGVVWVKTADSGTEVYSTNLKTPVGYVYLAVLKVIMVVLTVLLLIFCVYYVFDVLLARKLSLFFKQISVILPVIALVLAFFLYYTNDTMNERLLNEMDQRIMTYTVTASRLFDGDKLESFTSTQDVYSEDFSDMRALQNDILNHNSDDWNRIFYNAIYLYRDDMIYLLSISNDSSPNLSYYSDFDESWYEWQTFHEGTAFSDITVDSTGEWLYAQSPIYNSNGEIVAVFETGADLSNFRTTLADFRRGFLFRILMLCPIIVLSLCVITFVTLRYLSRTGKAVERIAAGNFDVRIDNFPNDELGDICAGINTMAQNLSTSFAQTSRLRDVYFRFVPIQFMQLLGKDSITEIKLGDGANMDMSVLFFDIRSFSISSEMMTTAENFLFVNRITKLAGPIIRANNGFIDKYIGDAVMALFTDAQSAVNAGVQLYNALVLNPQTRVQVGDDHINIGIGIHSGMTMIGIIGEEERLSSTVISNTVNLSSRLESLTKQYRAGMIISKDTLDRMSNPESIRMRFLGMVQVAGVNEIKALFEVLDCLDTSNRNKRIQTKDLFENGVRKFHLGSFDDSIACFKKVQKIDPDDIVVAKYITYIEKKLETGDIDSKFFRFEKK